MTFLVLASTNAKVGDVSATYAPIAQTCPDTCNLKGNGCYAQSGNVAIHNRKREREHDGSSPDHLALLEANEIRSACISRLNTRPLRLHVSGDTTTAIGAQHLAAAAYLWRLPVWTYTHAWRTVKRTNWECVSILASVETDTEQDLASAQGYAPARVFAEFPNGHKPFEVHGVTYIPCPAQTGDVTCTQCKLCWNSERLRVTGMGIAFAAHGSGKKKLTLNVLQENVR